MIIKVGINGFGRIGRIVFRVVQKRFDIEIVVINDLLDVDYMVYMLKYDFIYGRFDGIVEVKDGYLIVNGKKIRVIVERDSVNLKWDEVGVDVVVEVIGLFLIDEIVRKYIIVGAKKVVMIGSFKDNISMFVKGVNFDKYVGQDIVFNVFCIINCLVSLVKVINDNFGIIEGLMIIVYVIIVIQKIVDGSFYKDWRGGRGVFQNIISFFIGVVKVVGKVLLELNGKLIGMAFRVSISNVFVVDLIVRLEKVVIYEQIKVVVKVVVEGEMKGVLGYIEDDVVFIDFNGEVCIFVFDVKVGIVLNDNFVKLVFWYDNEIGYFNKVLDLIVYIFK